VAYVVRVVAVAAIVEDVDAEPLASLREQVRSYHAFRRAGVPPGVHNVSASAHVKLIVALGRAFDYVKMADDHQAPASFRAFVVGPHVSPAAVRHRGEQAAIEVEIPPLWTHALLATTGGDLGPLVVDLEAVVGASAACGGACERAGAGGRVVRLLRRV
jgi:hypothetical protein